MCGTSAKGLSGQVMALLLGLVLRTLSDMGVIICTIRCSAPMEE
jgi:hypothetical protein